MKLIKILLCFCLIVAGLAALAWGYFLYTPNPDSPKPAGEIHRSELELGGHRRQYTYFIPSSLPRPAPLVFVFHGSAQTIEKIRKYTGYEFERLAEENHFIVIYPQGYEKNWNDCRKSASYPAKLENIDDVGFVNALIDQFVRKYHINTAQIFMAGWSNGAHLGFRFALEKPDWVAGVAAISANVPTADNNDCNDKGQSVPMLIMNGTKDPLNPYIGGQVSLFGFGNRGTVLSSQQSAHLFAERAGYGKTIPKEQHVGIKDEEPVSLLQWRDQGKPEVALYTLIGGGHAIPQPVQRFPRLLGPTFCRFNGVEAIWRFFQRQIPNDAHVSLSKEKDGTRP